MSLETLRDMANDLDAKGTIFYTIKDGFFRSTRHAPQYTVEIQDEKQIRANGDVLLRVFCDKGTVNLFWPFARVDEENQPLPVFTGAHIEVFRDGYPLGPAPFYTKSEPTAKLWATYQILSDRQAKALHAWSDPTDSTHDSGLKMQYGEEVWQIVGRLDPGHSVNTIQRRRNIPLTLS